MIKYPMKYIFREEVQDILDIFTVLFDIRIAFFSTDGKELKVGKHKGLCQYCSLLRGRLDYENTCLDLDQKMRYKALTAKKIIHYQCHGNMTEAITPIYIKENLTGFLMIGQFRTSEQSINKKILHAWKERYGTDELEQAFLSTPCFTSDKANNILKLFNVMVDHFLYRHIIYLQSHMEEHLNIAEASNILLQSQSTLSHKFKRLTRKSFKRFQIDLKLDKADEYFKKDPQMPVKEVAYHLGYKDQYYFSRLYKKYRGRCPSAAQKKFRK
jgi:AraC-like DNA-binding protein